jgi:hypothetical protein
VLEGAGINGVTPHMFRRTVATAVNMNASIEPAAELLGRTDTRVTVMHYIQRSELVNRPPLRSLIARSQTTQTEHSAADSATPCHLGFRHLEENPRPERRSCP